ncbi:DUF6482 family protein [Marinobacter goseongensis]|uniref:DUF6482 family protein n=1 Tax=Marinobacter goseongensis TaxID=453838 RepID=UPI002003E340|nr:DUF6482 family protein [Marinobacter goseongensis]
MRITFDQLNNSSHHTIDLLEIISIEGQQYMARLRIGDQLLILSDKNGKTRLFRSSWQIQDALGAFSIARTDVVHPSAYHEMVGMEPAGIEPMRIRVQGRGS